MGASRRAFCSTFCSRKGKYSFEGRKWSRGGIKAAGAIEAETIAAAGLRDQYIAAVSGLKAIGDNLLKFGIEEKYVAEALSITRRKLGEVFKDATPADLREWIYKFNEIDIKTN
ncbi:hypothetical protein LZZ85_21890 [Terrimonas sp. NA20]|uniref:Uncharacterized protein n=1 Tax=Terrimonas ginsenosidimutans TaxID=2908004 RepID=A0ABS9KX64_9BACT|nr:hypothetical protein [Terrimonas ginsenosidimutans]MCG2616964.1 hypothetical protein [Terrimonas ginsenosidimutans]